MGQQQTDMLLHGNTKFVRHLVDKFASQKLVRRSFEQMAIGLVDIGQRRVGKPATDGFDLGLHKGTITFFAAPQFYFRLVAFRHIPDCGDNPRFLALLPQRQGQFDEELLSITVQSRQFDILAEQFGIEIAREKLRQALSMAGAKPLGHQNVKRFPEHLLFGISEHFLRCRIENNDQSLVVNADEGIADNTKYGVKAFFAPHQGLTYHPVGAQSGQHQDNQNDLQNQKQNAGHDQPGIQANGLNRAVQERAASGKHAQGNVPLLQSRIQKNISRGIGIKCIVLENISLAKEPVDKDLRGSLPLRQTVYHAAANHTVDKIVGSHRQNFE